MDLLEAVTEAVCKFPYPGVTIQLEMLQVYFDETQA